jgi:hypothetical protein
VNVAMPSATFFLTFLRTLGAVFAMFYPYYFLPAMALRGPLRVRALVRVR